MILVLKIVSCEIREKLWKIVAIVTGKIAKFLEIKLDRAKTAANFINSQNNNWERGNARNKKLV